MTNVSIREVWPQYLWSKFRKITGKIGNFTSQFFVGK